MRGGFAENNRASFKDTNSGGGGGGGSSSRISQLTTGKLYYIDFSKYPDCVLPSATSGTAGLSGPDYWYVHSTNDQGTWEIADGILRVTSNGNMDKCRRSHDTWQNVVYEYGMYHPATTTYIGGRQLVQAGSTDDYDQLIRNLEWQKDYNNGSGGATDTSVRTIANSFSRYKFSFNRVDSTHHLVTDWDNRKSHLSAFNILGTSPDVAGGIGAIAYQGQYAGITDYAVYSGTTITLAGLSSGYGFQLFDAYGNVVGSSGGSSGGVASLNTAVGGSAALCDMPFFGYMIAYSDQGTWATPLGGGRFPGEGITVFWGGDTYNYT